MINKINSKQFINDRNWTRKMVAHLLNQGVEMVARLRFTIKIHSFYVIWLIPISLEIELCNKNVVVNRPLITITLITQMEGMPVEIKIEIMVELFNLNQFTTVCFIYILFLFQKIFIVFHNILAGDDQKYKQQNGI